MKAIPFNVLDGAFKGAHTQLLAAEIAMEAL
jgi:hypothetical protein